MTITIPTFDWKQIAGDMNPGAHGGIIARADGQCIEVREILPTIAYVGEVEAASEVGFPFWSKDGYYDAADLDPARDEVQQALKCCGVDLDDIEPEHLAVCIAECLLTYGSGSDEGPAGWAEDVIPGPVLWWRVKEPVGAEYLSDEDSEFAHMLQEHGELSDKAQEILNQEDKDND